MPQWRPTCECFAALLPATVVLASIIALAGAAPPASAESMRCGRWVVTAGMTPADIRRKCGEPSAVERSVEDVFAPAAGGRGTTKVGVTTTERWTYARGSNAFTMVVVIRDGRTVSLGRAP